MCLQRECPWIKWPWSLVLLLSLSLLFSALALRYESLMKVLYECSADSSEQAEADSL